MATRPGRTRRRARDRLRLLACRVLVVLAAACFVAAFTIAALAPPGLSLDDGLQRLAGHPLFRSGWRDLALPFLLRPAWLLPVMLGMVSAGIAFSLGRPLPGGAAR